LLAALLPFCAATAADYYWDSNNDGAGFGTTDGTWAAPTVGTATGGFTTDATGTTDIVGVSVTTTTADTVYIGAEYKGADYDAKITIDGTVSVGHLVHGSTKSFGGVNSPTFNFAAEGIYENGHDNRGFPSGTILTGAGTSMTWKSIRNTNISNITTNNAGKNILSTSSLSPYPYPGRTVVDNLACLGSVGTPLVFDHGTLRMNPGFPLTKLSDLHADHPISFVADKDAGVEVRNADPFTVDLAINLGTGTFWPESSGGKAIVLTQNNTWGQINLTGAVVEVSDAAQLGPVGAVIQFGSGDPDELGSGVLRIAGTTFSSLGGRNLLVTDSKDVAFEIADAAHTFTIEQALTMAQDPDTGLTADERGGRLIKSGPGTLVLSNATNTYTGATTVSAGTLRLEGGSQASPITVASGAALGLEIGSETTSSASVDLTNGTVTISNSGVVDGSSDYLLMTASGGFTFTDIATQLGTSVSGYELQLQNSNTELWLVFAASGTDYASWAGGFAGFSDTTEDLDSDGGGLESGVEYVVGGDPTDPGDDVAKTPTSTDDGTNLIFTFTRDQASIHPDTTVTVEAGTDLSNWPEVYTIGEDTAGSGTGVAVDKDTSPGFDTVTVTIPKNSADKKFARLQVTVASP